MDNDGVPYIFNYDEVYNRAATIKSLDIIYIRMKIMN